MGVLGLVWFVLFFGGVVWWGWGVGCWGGGWLWGPCLVGGFVGGFHLCDEVVAFGDVCVDCLGGVVVVALGDVFDEGFGVGDLVFGFGWGGLGGEFVEEVGCGGLGGLGVVFGGVLAEVVAFAVVGDAGAVCVGVHGGSVSGCGVFCWFVLFLGGVVGVLWCGVVVG